MKRRSTANLSDQPHWSFVSAYNAQSNVPFNETSTSCITPINIVPDSALLDADAAGVRTDDFLRKEADVTLQ